MTSLGVIKRLAVVTLVLLFALNYVAYFDLQSRSAGGAVLDLRPLGYTTIEAQWFVEGLSFEAKMAYKNVYLVLDYVFIGFLFALLSAIAMKLKPRRYFRLVILFAIVFAVSDITENILVFRMVSGETGMTGQLGTRLAVLFGEPGYAPIASLMTQVKFAALLLAAAAGITCWRQEGAIS